MGLFDKDKVGKSSLAPVEWTIEERGFLYKIFHGNHVDIANTYRRYWLEVDAEEGDAKAPTDWKKHFHFELFNRNIHSSTKIPDWVKSFLFQKPWKRSGYNKFDKVEIRGQRKEIRD